MASEWMVITCMGPWRREHRAPITDPKLIIEIAEERILERVAGLTDGEKRLLDPYSLTRTDDPDDEHEPIDEAIAEWMLEALSDLLRNQTGQFAAQGAGIAYEWITGGVSPHGMPPTDAFDTIRALRILGLWGASVTEEEIERAMTRIAERETRSASLRKKG